MAGNEFLNNTIENYYRAVDSEKSVLRYIIQVDPMLVNDLMAEWFSPAYVILFNVVNELKAKVSRDYLVRDLITTPGYDPDVYAVILDDLFDPDKVPDKRTFDVYVDELIHMYESRQVILAACDVIESVAAKSFDVAKAKSLYLATGQNTVRLNANKALNVVDSLDYVMEDMRLRAADDSEVKGTPTGIAMFDFVTGGLMKSEFGVIAGQPSIGKTATLGSFATSGWESGENVLFCTGEMPGLDIAHRLYSNMAGIAAKKFRFGDLTEADFIRWEREIDNKSAICDGFFEIMSYSRNFSVSDILADAYRIQDKHKKPITALYVDYLNIMSPSSVKGRKYTSNKSWDSQGDVVWEVKELYASLNGGITGWTAGQIKDEYIDSPALSLEALKYSRAISETSPVIAGLVKGESEDFMSTLELQVLKMRNAERFEKSIVLRPNLAYMRIHEEVSGNVVSLLDDSNVVEIRKKLSGYKK